MPMSKFNFEDHDDDELIRLIDWQQGSVAQLRRLNFRSSETWRNEYAYAKLRLAELRREAVSRDLEF